MARDIGEVFDAMVPEAAARDVPGPASTPTPPEPDPDDTPGPEGSWVGIPLGRNAEVGVAIAWNLLNRLEKLGYPCSILPDQPTPEPVTAPAAHTNPGTNPSSAPILLDCLDARPSASLAAGRRAPTAWLLLLGPDDDARVQARDDALAIAYWQPGARIGVTTLGPWRAEQEAEEAFEALALAVVEAGGAALTHLGPLVHPDQMLQAWSNRRPLELHSEKSRAWTALTTLAEALLAFLASPAPAVPQCWLDDALQAVAPDLQIVARNVRAESTAIDLLAASSDGQIAAVFDARRDEMSCFTRALGCLTWLESELTHSPLWLQLAPALGVDPQRQPRLLLLVPASQDGTPRFRAETLAAAGRLPEGTLELIEAPSVQISRPTSPPAGGEVTIFGKG